MPFREMYYRYAGDSTNSNPRPNTGRVAVGSYDFSDRRFMVGALDMAAKGEWASALTWIAILMRLVDAAFVAVIVFTFAQTASYWPTISALEFASVGALLMVFFGGPTMAEATPLAV
jgi:hypothetical protein